MRINANGNYMMWSSDAEPPPDDAPSASRRPGHVYSREYFTLVRSALSEDGVALQWLGRRPRRVDLGALGRLRQSPITRNALDAVGLTDQHILRSRHTASAPERRRGDIARHLH